MKHSLDRITLVAVLVTVGGVWLSAQVQRPNQAQNPSPSVAATEPPISTEVVVPDLTVSPTTLDLNVTTTIIATLTVPNNPRLLPDSVTLIRFNGSGQVVGQPSRMYNDGTHGDKVAGDYIYTLAFQATESQVGEFLLAGSVAYQGRLARVLSSTLPVTVYPADNAKAFLSALIAEVNSGDLNAAAQRFADVKGYRNQIKGTTAANRTVLLQALQAAQFLDGDSSFKRYKLIFNNADGSVVTVRMTLQRTPIGSWFITGME